MKETLMQYFEWNLPSDGRHWKRTAANARALAANGFSLLWLPPAFKGFSGMNDVGYGIYDLYDLGEFDAKGSVLTKYGSKEDYLQAVRALQKEGIGVLADIVLNHKMGADCQETVIARDVNTSNREQTYDDPRPVQVWTCFTFPARKGVYSSFQWNWQDFSGTDYTKPDGSCGILLFDGKHWSTRVSAEQGNFDFIMGCDVDFSSERVRKELYDWGVWFTSLTGVNGFRIDAVKSIDAAFFRDWLRDLRKDGSHPDYFVGEYWSGDVKDLRAYLCESGHCMKLFDVPLHFHFYDASRADGRYDMHSLFKKTLSLEEPAFACGFVDNHDTQPGQALSSWVLDWFKPHAYAILLLGELPSVCVFYGDYYGMPSIGHDPVPFLKEMVWLRANLAGDYVVPFEDDDLQKLCWMVGGDHPILVLLSIGDHKQSCIEDLSLAGLVFTELQNPDHQVTFDENGRGSIACGPGSCSVYVSQADYETLRKAMDQLQASEKQAESRMNQTQAA